MLTQLMADSGNTPIHKATCTVVGHLHLLSFPSMKQARSIITFKKDNPAMQTDRATPDR